MEITKQSLLTGKTHTKDIDVTQEQLDAWKAGALIQDVCGHLSKADREFIMTGSTQEEWDELEESAAEEIIEAHGDADMSAEELKELLIQNDISEAVATKVVADMR